MITEQSKIFEIPKYSNATEKIVKEFVELIDYLDIQIFRRKMRTLVFHFISTEHGNLTGEFQKFAEQLPMFFDFLDLVEDELSKKKTT